MTGLKHLFIYWLGRHNLGPGWQFQKTHRPGKPPGRISPGHLDRVLCYRIFWWLRTTELEKDLLLKRQRFKKFSFQNGKLFAERIVPSLQSQNKRWVVFVWTLQLLVIQKIFLKKKLFNVPENISDKRFPWHMYIVCPIAS